MAQHDMNVANADGATVRADLNNALAALVSLTSGATAPTTVFAYMPWVDTANNLLKQRNAANSAWVTVATLGETYGTLGTAAEWTAAQNFNATALSDGATINWNLDANQVTQVTLGGNRTMAAPTNMKDGGFYGLTVIQDATGGRTLSWNSVFKFPAAAAPALSAGANARDEFVFRSNGTNLYLVGHQLDVR